MGKSQLAVEYLYKSKPPSALWLHGENRLLTFQIQTYLEKAHKIDATKEKDQSALLRKFYETIGKDALVIFDNVEDNGFIQKFLPLEGTTKIIITSRYRGWDFPMVELTQFSEAETSKYLRETFG